MPGVDRGDTRPSRVATSIGEDGFARVDVPRAATVSDALARLSAERDGEPFLVFQDAVGSQVILMLDQSRPLLSIGRSGDADLSLAWDPCVSRLHAQIERVADEVVIVDDGLSSFGTFVDGERVVGRRRLRDGNAIRVGSTVILFRRPDLSPGATTRAGVGVRLSQLTENQRRILNALCRPYMESAHLASPASNKEIAREACLAEATVKANLRSLFALFDLEKQGKLAQNQKRARLADKAIAWGLVSQARD